MAIVLFGLSVAVFLLLVSLLRSHGRERELSDRLAAASGGRAGSEPQMRFDVQSLVGGSPDPMILTDADENVVMLNAAAARLLEVSPASVIGRPFVSVITDQVLLDVYDSARAGGGGGAGGAGRSVKVTRSGGARLVFEAVGIRNADGSVMLLLRDVTQMAAIVQMKTDFVTNAGHELRTPVAAVKMAVDTLKDCTEDREQTGRCLAILEGQVRRLQEMLGDLLDLSRVESPELQAQVRPLKASEVFAQISGPLGAIARERELTLELSAGDGDAFTFQSDPRLLSLVLRNLVENAIKFTPAGGKVTATIASDPGNGRGPGGWALVVSDNGIGIPAEHQQRVFERFYQVDAARTGGSARGTGLGLAIVKHAVQVLGGTIELTSTPGKGTTVRCRFGG